MDPETGASTLFLSAPGSPTNAELSPDGTRVVYESRIPRGVSQIFVREADGTRRRLTDLQGGASDPSWSPDGTQIAFAGTRRQDGDRLPDADIFVADADSGRVRRVAGTSRDDGHPDWSPDGSRIVFHSRWDHNGQPAGSILVASIATRSLTRLDGSRWSALSDPAWSPDGRWIAYGVTGVTVNGRPMNTALQLMRPNGSYGGVVWESDSFDLIENPSWSPDGRSIVFEENHPSAVGVRWEGAVGDIGIIDMDGERLRWIAKGASSDQPSWGTDGILVSLSPGASGAMPRTNMEAVWTPSWTPPDATVVLTGSGCELDGEAGRVEGGVLAIEFANESGLDGVFKVVRLTQDRELDDLRGGWGVAGGWGRFQGPSTTGIWSSPRKITSGTWAVVCWKDLLSGPHGLTPVRVDVAGPIEVGAS